MANKSMSELSKLSVNMSAFDMPVREGGEASAPHEPGTAPKSSKKRTPGRQPATRAAKLLADAAERHAAGISEIDVSTLFRTDSPVGGTANGNGVPSSNVAPAVPLGGRTKRALDIALSGSTLLLLSPLFVVVALLIYLTMGRPIFFPQARLGFSGRPFFCFKFRTMVNDASTVLKDHLASNPEAALEWSISQKLERDPRVTTLGRLLRRSSIDELPQLFNVLRGDMSCVGPRPIIHDEIARYGRYWRHYTRARPGLSGAWQVSGRNRLSYPKRVALDTHYVRKWSVGRDMWILVRTIPAVLRSDTA